ncbi:MAG: ATP-binding cassette domain-containing protein, partial [Acidimicrobiales bacterium]|nr:ATP-binding cassette domain-containing protein [Acidimicrobiales bacterium]
FQRLELFGSLTVRDNLRTAAELRRKGGDDPGAVADRIAERVGLTDVVGQRADSLSTGKARLVELGRALACHPRVLLLDEPASGLDEHETEEFASILRSLADEGLGILIVEHDVPLVMRLCQQITVLNFGTVLAAGSPTEVQKDQAVIDAYLGQEAV